MGILADQIADLPGDPATLRTFKQSLNSHHDASEDASTTLTSWRTKVPTWSGKTEEKFAKLAKNHNKSITKLIDGLSDASRIVEDYACALEERAKKVTDLRAEVEAIEAKLPAPTDPTYNTEVHKYRYPLDTRFSSYESLISQAKEDALTTGALLEHALHYDVSNIHGNPQDGEYDLSQRKKLTPEERRKFAKALKDGTITNPQLRQGAIGDCYLLSCLNSLMHTEKGRKQLLDGVKPYPPGANPPDGFMVTLYDDMENNPEGGGRREVFVDSIYANGAHGDMIFSIYEAAYGQIGRKGTTEWPGRDYLGLGFGSTTFPHLTGDQNTSFHSGSEYADNFYNFNTEENREDIITKVNNGTPVVATSHLVEPDFLNMNVVTDIDTNTKISMPAAHVYTVVAADSEGVTLINPWGFNDIKGGGRLENGGRFTLSWAEFSQHYGWVESGTIP